MTIKVALQENQAVENTARQTRQTKRKLTESQESVQSSNTPVSINHKLFTIRYIF